MKALILAGGKGTRLRPLTFTAAKQLIPVANKPTIFYGIEDIVEAGIDEVGIIVGETGEAVKEVVGDGSRWGIDITYIHQDQPLGLAHAVKVAEDFLGDEPFVMYLGDNILREGITNFVELFEREQPDSLILLTPVPNPSLYGVAELEEDGTVKNLIEKPDNPPSNLALVGVYLFQSDIFDAIDNIEPSWRGELEITHAIQWLLDNGRTVQSHTVHGWWKDTGNAQDLLEANQLVLESVSPEIEGSVDEDSELTGRIQLGTNSVVRNSVLRGPIVIGENTTIEDAYIGPFTSIGNNVEVIQSEVEHSIFMDDCQVRDVARRIDQSVLGKEVRLNGVTGRPKTHQFVIGDQSDVGLSRTPGVES